MTVMVPSENAGRAGLRRVIDDEAVEKVLAVLRDDVSQMPKNWNRRFKHNRDKIKTGDVYELAEVVRNLAIREADKGLSTGEKQMYTRAKKILASELMYALDMEEGEAEEHLDSLISDALAAAPEATVAVVHDAARPLVTRDLVERCIAALPGWEGAIAAAPVTDTIKQADADGRVVRTLERSTLWSIQTPQVFDADALRRALDV